jgi:hypothetical protein
MRRPTGVAILAGFLGLASVLLFFYAGVMYLVSSASAELPIPGFSMLTSYIAAGALATGALALATALGLWGLKRWGWLLAVVLGLTCIALTVLGLGRHSVTTSTVAAIALAGLVILYLCLPHVRRAFGGLDRTRP